MGHWNAFFVVNQTENSEINASLSNVFYVKRVFWFVLMVNAKTTLQQLFFCRNWNVLFGMSFQQNYEKQISSFLRFPRCWLVFWKKKIEIWHLQKCTTHFKYFFTISAWHNKWALYFIKENSNFKRESNHFQDLTRDRQFSRSQGVSAFNRHVVLSNFCERNQM